MTQNTYETFKNIQRAFPHIDLFRSYTGVEHQPTDIYVIRDGHEVDEAVSELMIRAKDQSDIWISQEVALQNYHIKLFEDALTVLNPEVYQFLPVEYEADPEPDDFDDNQDFYRFGMRFINSKYATYAKLSMRAKTQVKQ